MLYPAVHHTDVIFLSFCARVNQCFFSYAHFWPWRLLQNKHAFHTFLLYLYLFIFCTFLFNSGHTFITGKLFICIYFCFYLLIVCIIFELPITSQISLHSCGNASDIFNLLILIYSINYIFSLYIIWDLQFDCKWHTFKCSILLI